MAFFSCKTITNSSYFSGQWPVTTSNDSVLAGGEQGDITLDSFTKDFYFTAKSAGTAVISFGPNATNMLADPNTSEFFNQYRTVTITVVDNN